MIDAGGNWRCDFCAKDFGEFYHHTGNHVSCQDLAEGQAQIKALNNMTVTTAQLLGRVMADRDIAFTNLAKKDAEIERLREDIRQMVREAYKEDCFISDGSLRFLESIDQRYGRANHIADTSRKVTS